MDVVDGVGQLTTAPVFQTVDLAAVFFDGLGVTLDHTANLLTLIRVNQEDDFVMTHKCSLRLCSLPPGRSGKE
ncbi:hypothetical protein D3C81_2012210 [compost metagenome]